MALFAEDAVYTEPFAGKPRTHRGHAAIRRCFVEAWQNPPPDLTLTVDRVDIDAEHVTALWTCASPAFAQPVRGRDAYEIVDGQIRSLVVSFA